MAEVKAKLEGAEATAEKLRKAAAHWKAQHAKLKEQQEQSAAAPAAAEATAASEATAAAEATAAELSAARARVAALEAEMAEAGKAKAEVDATLEKYKKAATHWKRQFDQVKASGGGATAE